MYRSDWHIHTAASYDAKTTVREILASFERQGMTEVGISDHINSPSWLHYLQESRALFDAHKREGFHFGVELTTISGYQEEYDRKNGNILGYTDPKCVNPVALPLTEEELRSVQVEYVIGAAHWALSPCERVEDTIADFHRQQLWLAADPRVNIVGHPWCMYSHTKEFNDISLIPQSMRDEFFAALLENGKCMEINIFSFIASDRFCEKLRRGYMEFVREAFERGVPITVGSDCHGPAYPDSQIVFDDFMSKVGFKAEDFSRPKFRTY